MHYSRQWHLYYKKHSTKQKLQQYFPSLYFYFLSSHHKLRNCTCTCIGYKCKYSCKVSFKNYQYKFCTPLWDCGLSTSVVSYSFHCWFIQIPSKLNSLCKHNDEYKHNCSHLFNLRKSFLILCLLYIIYVQLSTNVDGRGSWPAFSAKCALIIFYL